MEKLGIRNFPADDFADAVAAVGVPSWRRGIDYARIIDGARCSGLRTWLSPGQDHSRVDQETVPRNERKGMGQTTVF